jgi:hypothetical protein
LSAEPSTAHPSTTFDQSKSWKHSTPKRPATHRGNGANGSAAHLKDGGEAKATEAVLPLEGGTSSKPKC